VKRKVDVPENQIIEQVENKDAKVEHQEVKCVDETIQSSSINQPDINGQKKRKEIEEDDVDWPRRKKERRKLEN
jgi:hypothetical protein